MASPERKHEEENEEGQELVESLRRELLAARREMAELHRALDRVFVEKRELEQSQRTFFGLVAHQLKGPMLPLELSLQTIRRALELGRPLHPDTVPRALRQARRLVRTIDALLVDLPRLEEGTLQVGRSSFDLREPVRGAVEELRLVLESRKFELTEPDSPVWVMADPERVGQIVMSLLDNAVKYSPPGCAVEIRFHHGGDDGSVIVRDRGIGIPEREQAQLFSKFFRGSNAPSYLYRGLGVGLYLARALAELCSGKLSVASEEGEGTVCTLTLPAGAPT